MIDEFDKIYVISDLHMGGPKGRRAFREGRALIKLIQHVRADKAQRVALILNGDIVDFLAAGPEAPEFTLRPDIFFQQMADDAEYKPVFAELAALVNDRKERWLVLQIGNHDIELALAPAQETLRKLLKANTSPSASRVIFETSGRGWICKVGPRVIQIVHGNAEDPWNVVDHERLATASRDSAGAQGTFRLPDTNAGTTMVCKVINKIKVTHPFVDLLKPEDAPLMAVLAAVDPGTNYRGLAQALLRRLPQRQFGELLGAGGEPALEDPQGPEKEIVDFLASVPLPDSSGLDALQRAEENLEKGRRVRDLVIDDAGRLRYVRDFARVRFQQLAALGERAFGKPDFASLRSALTRWLARDESFVAGRLAAIDLRILDDAAPRVDLVIAGHTHLPRVQSGAPDYINTGTWMRVLKLNGSRYLESDAAFKKFFDVVSNPHSVDDLDKLGIDPRLRPVAVVDTQSAGLYSVVTNKGFRLAPIV